MEMLISNSDLASALAAAAGVFIAALAFVISVISLYVSIKTLKHQQEHNKLSVKPIPEISLASYENSLRVKLRNNGSGPLLIKDFFVEKNGEKKATVFAWIGSLPNKRLLTHYATDIDGRSILPSKAIPLLELTQKESEKDFAIPRDFCRKRLKDLVCFVNYSDVYGTEFEPFSRDLTKFGRRS